MDMSPETVYGVDFSGANEAGKKVWVAEIDCTGEGPELAECAPATEYFDVSANREDSHRALTEHLATLNMDAVVGLDFPFALPEKLMGVDDWETFLLKFPGAFGGPEEFRRRCRSRAERIGEGVTEYKRETEQDHGGLAAYDYYLFKQTFYGIRDVLRPLALADAVRVPPMQPIDGSRPTVVETYPAGVLDELDEETKREKYKQSNEESRARRETNLAALRAKLTIADQFEDRLLDDSEGDGLDAALAAYGAWRNTAGNGTLDVDGEYPKIEGYIYV